MAENNRRGGESHQAGVPRPSLNPMQAWSALLNIVDTPDTPIGLVADDSGRQYVIDRTNNEEVFILPELSTSMFSSGTPYTNQSNLLRSMNSWNEEETRNMEKALKLKPTGVPGNAALVERFISEARKASRSNLSNAMNYKRGLISGLPSEPLHVIEQARLSSMTGDLTGGTRRSRSISVTQFSEGDARAILENFYADTLGRRPSDSEVKKFNTLINKQAKKQPSVSTTTYGEGGTSTTVSGGAGYSAADAQMAARKMAESDPEASAFLSSTRYLDAFMNAIGSQA